MTPWQFGALFLAGLTLFFTGVTSLRERLQQASGRRLRRSIARVTGRPWIAIPAGIGAGVVTQSASAVAFILAGMVATGLVELRAALPVIAASNVGTALLVFLAAFDLRTAVFYLIGVCGLALHFRVAPRWEGILGALFSVGLLFLGLDLMKQAFAPLPSSEGFREVASLIKDWMLAPFLLGAACRMFIQSSSAIGVIAIALQGAGMFTETQAMLLVCGAGPGVALASLFLSGSLKGTPRQAILYLGLVNLVSGCALAALIALDEKGGGFLRATLDAATADPSRRIALVFLASMAGCLAFGLAILPWCERLLDRLEARSPEEDFSRPGFIYDDALAAPDTAVELAAREQQRLLELTIELLDTVRDQGQPADERWRRFQGFAGSDAGAADGPGARGVGADRLHRGMKSVQGELRSFLGELVADRLDPQTSQSVIHLERRQEVIEAIEESVHEFVGARSSTPVAGRAEEIMERLTESTSLLLLTARDAWMGGDAIDLEHLVLLTADRGDMMERIRFGCRELDTTHEQQSAVFYSITLFERIVWLLRQFGLSLRDAPSLA